MFDPLSLMIVYGVGKGLQKILSGSSSGAASPASATTCRWCGDPISGGFNTTSCCHNKLCQSCTPQWQRAGGKNCVICGTTHA